MKKLARLVLVSSVVVTAGCYHAVVDTGRPPSGQTVEKNWAHGFLFGLVPPSEVQTAAECPSGVATVETQLSFLNQLASFLTAGIYTPMTITVQCASGRAAAAPGETIHATDDLAASLEAAALRSSVIGGPVFVRFGAVEQSTP